MLYTLYRTQTGEPLTVTNLTRIKYGYNAITPETGQAFFYSDDLWSTTRPVKTRFKIQTHCSGDAPPEKDDAINEILKNHKIDSKEEKIRSVKENGLLDVS